MAFHRCVDCLVQRMDEKKSSSVEHAAYNASLAITVIDGDAVCAEHLEKRLEERKNGKAT
jgi:hypothetical protein